MSVLTPSPRIEKGKNIVNKSRAQCYSGTDQNLL